jgi:hypothetical protein
MSDNPKFKRFALPNSDDSSKSYEEWTKNPVVNSIKGALEELGRKYQALREQLLSLFGGYPKSWIQQHLGVGRIRATKSKDHAAAFGAGLRQPAETSTITRNRRFGPVQEFLIMWMKRKDNCESSP